MLIQTYYIIQTVLEYRHILDISNLENLVKSKI